MFIAVITKELPMDPILPKEPLSISTSQSFMSTSYFSVYPTCLTHLSFFISINLHKTGLEAVYIL